MFKVYTILSSLILAACVQSAPPTVELCEQTVRDYAVFRDNGPVEAYADLFTENGTFQLGANVTKGREALIERHIGANSAASWRHTMGDIRINDNAGKVTGHSRFVVRTGAAQTPTPASREIVGHYEDSFIMEGGRCKIATRKVHIVFDTSS